MLEHSPDAMNWAESYRSGVRQTGSPGLDFVIHGNGRFLAFERTTTAAAPLFVLSSTDGRSWTKLVDGWADWLDQENRLGGYLVDLLFANGEFHLLHLVFAGGEFRLLSSPTGTPWSSSRVGFNLGLSASLFATHHSLFAVGHSIRQSPWDLKLRALVRRADGTLELQVSGIVGQQIELQAASSLVAPNWQSVSTAPLTASPMVLSVPEGHNPPQRFYRALAR